MTFYSVRNGSKWNKASAHYAFMCMMLLEGTLFFADRAHSGAYITATEANPNLITHSTGYTGNGGNLTVRVCINPASPHAAEMEIPVQNVIKKYNQLQATTGNLFFGLQNSVPVNNFDFESAVIHEIGHCIGLAHVNASSESGLTGNNTNYTKATDGANNTFDLNPGPDGVIGSNDDLRDDDGNLHWFEKNINNPFVLPVLVDATTYSRNLVDLPQPDSFAANGDRSVSILYGFPNTESVMQQAMGTDEEQRTLIADDIATLKMAMSGLDETAGTGDDYNLVLQYQGISATGCDINIAFDSQQASFAACSYRFTTINTRHTRITSANIFYNDDYLWHFNPVQFEPDTIPDDFSFDNKVDVELNADIESNIATISGISTPVSVVISGGEFSINEGPFTSVDSEIENGQRIQIKLRSSAEPLTASSVLLDIGGVTASFTVTTRDFDRVPDRFDFTYQSDVPRNHTIVSNTVQITGIETVTSITITNGMYAIGNADFTEEPGEIANNALLRISHTSASDFQRVTESTVIVGGIGGTFSSETVSDSIPDAFNFVPQIDVPLATVIESEAVAITGLQVQASISVGAGGEYSINDSQFTSQDGFVNNNDSIRIRHESSSDFSAIKTTSLSISGVQGEFSTTTLDNNESKNSKSKGFGAFDCVLWIMLLPVLLLRGRPKNG